MLGMLNPFTRKIGYTGWTGRGNLGDEALFAIIRKMLSPVELVGYRMFTRRGKFLEEVQDFFLDGIMMGAGTLVNSRGFLPKMKAFNRKGMPAYLFGAGVLDPEFYGRFPRYYDDLKEWVECLSRFRRVSVRGRRSAELLRERGLESVTVVGDPALSFAGEMPPERERGRSAGINVGTTKDGSLLWGESDRKVLEFAVGLGRCLAQRGYRITFYSVWKRDEAAVLAAAKSLGGAADASFHTDDMDAYMKALADKDLFIGEKLHAVIGAMAAYVPSVMLAYQPKCVEFMESMDLGDYAVRTDQLSMERILGLVEKIEKGGGEYRRNLNGRLAGWKEKQRKETDQIKKLVMERS